MMSRECGEGECHGRQGVDEDNVHEHGLRGDYLLLSPDTPPPANVNTNFLLTSMLLLAGV
jgi:hypothetical protein